ncbi:DNA-binding transcriptional regulator, XRE-family HTH domain [Marinitoga hydrogenitolerans DSM 16785]|uniref:DNA-binding transcriptional regulator, XRE-family HTH domain n=1 Tax=Marinitoga hydrogenitolerans (strain DSM 16785 / JCM 12826 / AT1271) TaxID=1122195 RepID=A0A1M4TR34_MARH1|nr:helix-turn-helix transcriptional regulator [Marinitoga hydrogenitolerans]SHE46970.1 DNA-binding transcriptional regulator, XRE-family HTH domain [Marinitoga hydrogenitolerans DSM 16785]
MKKIKFYRLKKGLTQKKLAKLLNVQQNTVAMWETGRSKPPLDKALKIAKALGTTVEELFDFNDKPLARR